MSMDIITEQELKDAETRFRLQQAYDALWQAYKLALGENGTRTEFADKIQNVKHMVEDLHDEVESS